MMVDFTETIEDIRLQNRLYISLNGSGSFRRFKDSCINFDIINDWYKFRDERYKQLAIDWCEKNKNNRVRYILSSLRKENKIQNLISKIL